MGSILFHSHDVLRFPACSFVTRQSKFGDPISFLRDVHSPSLRPDPRLTLLCMGSDGNRRGRPQGSSDPEATTKKEVHKKSPARKRSNSPNQEGIIALFRRIQSSISKEDSVDAEGKTSIASEDESSAQSILKVLSGSTKQRVKGKGRDKEGVKLITRRRGVPKKEQGIEADVPVTDFKLTRPPSAFVKRSPISSLTLPRGKPLQLSSESFSTADGTERDLPRVKEMKLTELKQLAKSRGIKGYSKLKKSELVTLLRS